jgi:hypothetical protein
LLKTRILAGFLALGAMGSGCGGAHDARARHQGAAATTPAVDRRAPAIADPALADPALESPPPFELGTVVTTNGAELIASIERATSPERLSDAARESFLGPMSDSRLTETRVRMGSFTCFARRTPKDLRAALLRNSKQGFVVAPIAWLAEVVQLPGVKPDDLRAWYAELSRQLATAGRASGLARFDNGNATAVALELRDLDRTDVEIVAESRFMRAGAYDPQAWGAVIGGAQNVKTKAMNEHRGVSVFDLLRKRPGETQAPPSTRT